MKAKKVPVTKINTATANKINIEGVGSFNVDAMHGMRKNAIAEQYPQLSPAQHEILWKAVSKGEMPEDQANQSETV